MFGLRAQLLLCIITGCLRETKVDARLRDLGAFDLVCLLAWEGM